MSGWVLALAAAVAGITASAVIAVNAGRIVSWLWPDGDGQ